MGVYERCDTKAPSGSPMYVNHNAGDDTKPKRYLYRADASTHGGARDGLWIACDDEGQVAKNQGVIRSVQADAELPTAAGLTWIQAEGLVVTEVRPGRAATVTVSHTPPLLPHPSPVSLSLASARPHRLLSSHAAPSTPTPLAHAGITLLGRRGRAGVDQG